MKKFKTISVALSLSMLLAGCSSKESTKVNNDADVNNLRKSEQVYMNIEGEEIPYSKFYQFYDLYAGIYALGNNLNGELTNLFILDKIISDDLQKEGIEIKDEEIDEEINLYVQNMGDEEKFNQYISMLGTTKEIFRENIKNSLKNEKHKELYISNLKISEKEKENYYEANKANLDMITARHILTENEEDANKAIERLNNGEDFATVANDLSIDTAANANGGSLGEFGKNSGFDQTFVDAAFNLKVGEISEPIKTDFGYHVIEVTDSHIGLEENDESIIQAIGEQRYNQNIQEIIQKAKVDFYDVKGNLVTSTGQSDSETSEETVSENTESTSETLEETVQE